MTVMKQNGRTLLALALALMLLLCACGAPGSGGAANTDGAAKAGDSAAQAAQSEAEAPQELSLGTLTFSSDCESLDFAASGAALEDLMALSGRLPQLKSLTLGDTGAELAKLQAVAAAFPQAHVSWTAQVLGSEISSDAETLDLTAATDADVDQIARSLAVLPALREITLAAEGGLTTLSFDSLAVLSAAAPQAALNCRFELYGQIADWTTEELRYAHQKIGNGCVEVFRSALPYLRSLKLLRLQECGIDDHEGMAALRADFPEKNVVWNVYLNGYPFMTDTTLIHFEMLRDADTELIRYLPDVMYLDIGHDMQLSNVEFVRYLPKLTTVIVSLTNLTDLSPFEDCPDITFFECFSMPVKDISVLAKLEKLEYVNIGNDWNLSDISPLAGLQNLKLVRICKKTFDHVTPAQVAELRAALPNTVINTDGGHPGNSGGWRYAPGGGYTERYALLREQCRYDYKWIDSLSNSPSAEG